jgi:hypothetical protein
MDIKSNTSIPEENTSKIKTHNAEWLKELEVQSWQAELVMSGLIITGLFQLPDVFIKWAETAIIQSGEIEYTFLNLASVFFLIGIDCLIIFFGIHLLFRGIWIALLGLNSVYPNGIDVLSKNGMGEKYWQKSKEKYPDLTAYNVELDANCSLLFSLATVTIIMISSVSIVILVFYQCIRFLISYFPIIADHILPIGIGAYLIYMVVALLAHYLGKKYPDNQRVLNIVNGYGTVMGTLFSLYIFQKPIGYIIAIYSSNVKSKYLKYIFMLVSAVMGFMGGRHIGKSSAFNDFNAEKYFTFNNKSHQILAFNYENLIAKEDQIYTPVIQSDVITDDFLKVFIPTIARETAHISFKEPTIAERFKLKTAQRDSLDKVRFETYKQFNRIFINDVEQPNLDYQFYTHPQATERGLLVYVPSEHFVKGRNILEIRKNYFSKDSVQKIVKIPFFFEKK